MPSVSLLFITRLWIHVSKMDVHFSLYLQELQYVDKILSLVSRLMCQTRTHTEKGNEYIIYAAHSRARRSYAVYSAGSCKFLLNHQGLIDRKTMRCHFAGATVINTFVIFFVCAPRHYCFVGPDPSPVQWMCFKMVVSRMLLAAPRSLGGTKHRNNWLVRRRERLQAAIWLERTQRRDTKSVKEEDRRIGGRGAGRSKGTSTEQRQLCVRSKTTVRLASESRKMIWNINVSENDEWGRS